MPTVLREDGFEVMIYTDDHEPPHVHVFYGGVMVIINLRDFSARKAKNMKISDVRRARKIVANHQEFLLGKWKEFHRRNND